MLFFLPSCEGLANNGKAARVGSNPRQRVEEDDLGSGQKCWCWISGGTGMPKALLYISGAARVMVSTLSRDKRPDERVNEN